MGWLRAGARGTAVGLIGHIPGMGFVLHRSRRPVFGDAAGLGLALRPHPPTPAYRRGIQSVQIGASMNEQDFQAKLTDLMQQLDGLPSPAREQLQQIASD